jgi:hypothetical protein
VSEHYRPVGDRTDARVLAQGYWCAKCGGSVNMLGHHGHGTACKPNPELVHRLSIVNSPTWEEDMKRFTTSLADELLP